MSGSSSNWSRHFFSASFDADRSWYNDFSVEDDKTYFAQLRGRLDVTRRTHLELELGKSQTQEGRNSISLTDIAGVQTNVQEEHITAGADHTFNRLTLDLEGTVATYDYSDLGGAVFGVIDPTVPTVIPTQDVRDYREDELTLRGTYELKPQMGVFVEGGISQEVYKQPVSVSGITRDSSGYELLSGMTFAVSSTLTGEFSLGWGEQTSIDEIRVADRRRADQRRRHLDADADDHGRVPGALGGKHLDARGLARRHRSLLRALVAACFLALSRGARLRVL